MKRSMFILAGILTLLVALALPGFAADDKEVTVTGMGTCAKCALHETAKCQTVIQVDQDGKTVNYYLADNDMAKDFHDNVCKEPHKVTATGTVSKKHGKKILTVTKIDLVK
jgi:hypothetical protein